MKEGASVASRGKFAFLADLAEFPTTARAALIDVLDLTEIRIGGGFRGGVCRRPDRSRHEERLLSGMTFQFWS